MAATEKTPPRGQGLLVWMDLEMTGLDPDKDVIIEMATLVTDSDLKITARGPEFIIHQPRERFELMDDWNREHHTKSGLWEKVVTSTITTAYAEEATLEFIKSHLDAKVSPLCGNSIWQDRRFLSRYMPRLESYLHYRMIDVSTVKELGLRWYGEDAKFTKPKGSHRAMDDITESIDELLDYRHKLFVKSLSVNSGPKVQ